MTTPATPAPVPVPARNKKWILLAVFGLCSAGAGVMAPKFMAGADSPEAKAKQEAAAARETFLLFGEVTVNLAEGRLSRYLRVKIVLSTETRYKQLLTDALEHRKATLKNWLIGHLSDKAMADVTGRVSINRIRRELLEQFNSMLAADKAGKIQDVLFEEFVVQ